MPFDGHFIFPPRTKMKTERGIQSNIVTLWSKMQDVLGQYKLNGQRNLIYVHPDRRIQMWNRGDDGLPGELQSYTIPENMKQEILDISPAGDWTVWDSELMHFKTTGIKNAVYLYDVLVFGGQPLIGKTYVDRYNLLKKQMGNYGRPIPLDEAKITESMYLAQNFAPSEWLGAWEAAKNLPWIEGLVLKRGGFVSRLEPGTQEYNNQGFMCRVRKPHKNYLS
jgi:hypothetical protein